MPSIEQLIPHRPPFLFVDEIIAVGEDTITTRRRVRPEEDFFKGHYPRNPIMPGVLICEAVFQSGCAMVSHQMAATKEDLARFTPVLARVSDVRFKSIVKPGDELIIDVKLKERMGRFLFLSGSVQTADHRKVLSVSFGVALLDKEAPATTPAGASPTQPAP
jgi:3-hydroxyacyl-[acyl-carrier-protein] dehydratase